MTKTPFMHHGLQCILVRVHADGLRQVAVTGIVIGHPFAQKWQHFEGVPVISLLQRLGNFGKLQHQQFTHGLENAVHFLQRHILVGHVAQTESNGHQVKTGIGKR